MDYQGYTTDLPKHKKGAHLTLDERAEIRALRAMRIGLRASARILGCSPNTVRNELKRGTPARTYQKGRKPGYSIQAGQDTYRSNRTACHRRTKIHRCSRFISWVLEQVRERKWSLDACCGYAKLLGLFEPSEMVCTRTLYNWVWKGLLPIKAVDLLEATGRKASKPKPKIRQRKRIYGASISDRPAIASLREEEGHWEGDTMIGRRKGREAVILTLLEKKTNHYIALRIADKTSHSVMEAMERLRKEFGDNFSRVFKTITVDNGSEFSEFAKLEAWGTGVFFAHPYSSWERAQNERHNGLFRAFFPKGVSLEGYSDEEVLIVADLLNGRPRKKLGYRTPEELFDQFLDAIFAA